MVEQVQQPGGVVLTIVTSQTLEEICRKVPADGLGKPVEIGLWSGAAKCRRDVGAALVEHAFDDGPGVVYIHATIVIFVVGVGGDA